MTNPNRRPMSPERKRRLTRTIVVAGSAIIGALSFIGPQDHEATVRAQEVNIAHISDTRATQMERVMQFTSAHTIGFEPHVAERCTNKVTHCVLRITGTYEAPMMQDFRSEVVDAFAHQPFKLRNSTPPLPPHNATSSPSIVAEFVMDTTQGEQIGDRDFRWSGSLQCQPVSAPDGHGQPGDCEVTLLWQQQP